MAERKNWWIVDVGRVMLEEKSMPQFYWGEAVRMVLHIQNQVGDKVSTHELYLGGSPS